MLNLKAAGIVQSHPWAAGSDQGFINEVYLWERLDLGLEHNLFMHYLIDNKYTIFIEDLRPVIYHFAGWKPETTCQDAERSVQCSGSHATFTSPTPGDFVQSEKPSQNISFFTII